MFTGRHGWCCSQTGFHAICYFAFIWSDTLFCEWYLKRVSEIGCTDPSEQSFECELLAESHGLYQTFCTLYLTDHSKHARCCSPPTHSFFSLLTFLRLVIMLGRPPAYRDWQSLLWQTSSLLSLLLFPLIIMLGRSPAYRDWLPQTDWSSGRSPQPELTMFSEVLWCWKQLNRRTQIHFD